MTVRGYVKDLMAATHMHSRGKLILTAAKAGYVHDGN
ncbi:DNA-binding NarL/FixJ family response regulator [Arcanobacterium wilhelmae]|uniref:DNA-binding NarL/FixJ family response regulator n=1 Tax=Arcanobacterium wilhelmae TaxID=1803177 RepID=A0ABT9NAX5_9ACTO|nr:DNA-binding NarL/FixJ family response regulator [Arcanobacterium wilhelmae]